MQQGVCRCQVGQAKKGEGKVCLHTIIAKQGKVVAEYGTERMATRNGSAAAAKREPSRHRLLLVQQSRGQSCNHRSR